MKKRAISFITVFAVLSSACAGFAKTEVVIDYDSDVVIKRVHKVIDDDPLANITDSTVKKIMKNTVMVSPEAEYAFVYGKRADISKDGKFAYEKADEIFIPADFLKENFPGSKMSGGEYESAKNFAAENGLKCSVVNNIVYLSEKEVPLNVHSKVNTFFGIYVSAKGKGLGTIESPLSGIDKAKGMVEAVKSSIGLPDGGLTVYFREGSYPVYETEIFTKKDSGKEGSPITYKAYHGEKVSFNGGINIKGSEFGEIVDVNMLKRLPYPDKVVCVDVSKRLGNFSNGFKSVDPAQWVLTYNGESLQLCRWPNREFALTGEVLETSKNWRTDGFRFVVDNARVKKWVGEEDPRIFGYFCYRWAGEYRKIKDVRVSDLSIKSDQGSEFDVLSGKEYYVYNLVSELDAPGEFYYDTKHDLLYLYPVEGDKNSAEFKNNNVQFAILSQDMLSFNECEYVTFDDIIFENSQGRVATTAANTTSINFLGCTFRNISAGIMQEGYDHLINGCDFYNITGNGIYMSGGDRNDIIPSGNVVNNCRFWNFNTVLRTNTGAIQARGCGNTVSHNEFVGGPHTVIALAGDENVIEYNEFYDCLQDNAEDAGTIYGGRNLSDQNAHIRYNYFHDIYNKSMAAIYYDDTLSNMHAEDNVFINTARSVFVHGGVNNSINSNLVINESGDGGAVRICGSSPQYWLTSNAQTLASNNFMWHLLQLNYKSRGWQRYKDTLKYMDSTAGVSFFPPYDTEFVGNTFVIRNPLNDLTEGVEAKGNQVAPYVKIKDNTVISGDDVDSFVIPEKYQKIIDEAGIYIDKDRKSLDKLGEFELLRPYNMSENVEASEVVFEWTPAENASRYLFTLATDKDFNNIISNKQVKSNSVTINKLNYGKTRYYWKVEAIAKKTNAVISSGNTKAGFYSFTTKKEEVLDMTKFNDIYDKCKNLSESVIEGSEPGAYKVGTVELMKEILEKYDRIKNSSILTQRIINKMSNELSNEFNKLAVRKNPQYLNMYEMLSSGSKWSITPNQFTTANGILKHTTISEERFGTANKIEPHNIIKFKANPQTLSSWIGFGIRAQASPNAVAWSQNYQYLFIIKEDTFEFQKWGPENNFQYDYPNNIVKAGETHEYEFDFQNQDDGSVRAVIKIDGNTLVDYLDNQSDAITSAGFFEVYGTDKNTYIELSAEPNE